MQDSRITLKKVIQKWLPLSTPGRVTRMRSRRGSGGYVYVEVLSASGPVSMYFFRHGDGDWCVFPPSVIAN